MYPNLNSDKCCSGFLKMLKSKFQKILNKVDLRIGCEDLRFKQSNEQHLTSGSFPAGTTFPAFSSIRCLVKSLSHTREHTDTHIHTHPHQKLLKFLIVVVLLTTDKCSVSNFSLIVLFKLLNLTKWLKS